MTDLKPINRFLAKVKQLSDGKSKDIRITVAEAVELTSCIAELLSSHAANLQRQINEITLPSSIKLDGGKLKEK